MNRLIIILIIISSPLFCSNHKKDCLEINNNDSHNYESFSLSTDDEIIITLSQNHQTTELKKIDMDYQDNSIKENYCSKFKFLRNNYTCCPQPYREWSCTDRLKKSFFCAATAGYCLCLRETITCQHYSPVDSDYSCAKVHASAWCEFGSWLYCSNQDITGSVITNTVSCCTIVPIVATLCILSPCIVKSGQNCIKKKN